MVRETFTLMDNLSTWCTIHDDYS